MKTRRKIREIDKKRERIPVQEVIFQKVRELSIKSHETFKLSVKYRNFSRSSETTSTDVGNMRLTKPKFKLRQNTNNNATTISDRIDNLQSKMS